jgi:hypothetical protein
MATTNDGALKKDNSGVADSTSPFAVVSGRLSLINYTN